MEIFQYLLIAFGLTASSGTLVSFHPSPHWSVRLWDYPRVQIAVVAAASVALYALRFFQGTPADWTFVASCLAALAWQTTKIVPYTPIAPVQVVPTRALDRPRVRLLISNVLMENTQHDLLFDRIRQEDPDVILLMEIDDVWAAALEPLKKRYPHVVGRVQGNYYGMVLYSRLELVDPRVEYLIQDDVPSVHTGVRLSDGTVVMVHGVHPRPPEPITDQDSAPRDAELLVVGKRIRAGKPVPTIIAGDLNDVAWSRMSETFLAISGLVDPRAGRGFFASFPTTVAPLRCPLDHVFHSKHFRLVKLDRLDSIGSDHFPMLIELSYEPED